MKPAERQPSGEAEAPKAPGLLLPSDYPTEPFVDASGWLDDPERLREVASRLGYLYFEAFVPASLVDPVRAFVREQCADRGWVQPDPANGPEILAVPGASLQGRGWDDPAWVELQLDVCRHADFEALVRDERVMTTLEVLGGEPMALAAANNTWLKLPGSPQHTTRPHRDSFYLPTCPRMWTVWFPLVDTPLDVGPLAVVPGSHDVSDWPQLAAFTGIDVPHHVTWVTGAVRPGDVVMFGVSTIHCAWSNVSPTKVRLSLDVRYEPESVPTPSILRPDRDI